jgi:hypothetical protein
VGQQEVPAIARDDPGGGGDVTRETGAFEAIRVIANKFANFLQTFVLTGVSQPISLEQVEQGSAVHGLGPSGSLRIMAAAGGGAMIQSPRIR